MCSLVDRPLTPLFLRISWVPPPMVWDRGIGQPHLPPAPFPAWSAISHTPAGDDAHFWGVQGRDSDLNYDTEGKKLPFKESRCFPHSHKFPWRRQDLIPKTRQTQTPLSFPLGAHDLMALVHSSSFSFSGSLQPPLLHISSCLFSVLGQNAAYPTQNCTMESQTSHVPSPGPWTPANAVTRHRTSVETRGLWRKEHKLTWPPGSTNPAHSG